MLFKNAEREQLLQRNAELEARKVQLEAQLEAQEVRLQIQILARRIAYLEARDVENTARIAELENQKAQQNEEERR